MTITFDDVLPSTKKLLDDLRVLGNIAGIHDQYEILFAVREYRILREARQRELWDMGNVGGLA